MLERLAKAVARRRWWVLASCAVLALAALASGRGLFGRLGYAVFYDPTAESTQAAALARKVFGDGDADVVALYRLPPAVRAPSVRYADVLDALRRSLARVAADPAVARVLSELTLGGQRFVSRDGRSTFVVVSLRGDPRAKAVALPRLERLLALELPGGERGLVTVRPLLGGLVPSGRALTHLAEQSLARGERIAFPLTALLLVVIFGSVVAALMPLLIGGLSIVLALAILALLAHVMSVDAFAINVVTVLGLGTAIDYALFLVSRYRQEVANGAAADSEPERRRQALPRAVATVGRSVLFSGVTVAASLSGLLVFRQPFLRSVAVGGMAVVLMSATLALVVLPAMLSILGPRLERGRISSLWQRARAPAPPAGHWRRLARFVLGHRVAVCAGVTMLLLLLALPFRRLQPSRSDVRALPANSEPRVTSERLERDFPETTLTPVMMVVAMPDDVADEDQLGALWDYVGRLQRLAGVARVESVLYFAGAHDRASAEALAPLFDRVAHDPTSERGRALRSILHGRYTLVRIISGAPPDAAASQRLVTELRAVPPPPQATTVVYGQAASLHDFAQGIRQRAPLMLLVVGLSMFFVLYRAFRSLILPLKAMLMTALSLTASFGALVFIFQDGRLQSLLHYRALGTIDASLPVVMFAVVFGLSMDYEVVILGRIREAYLRTHDNRAAIVDGLAQTGSVVTGAAALMIVVFSAFAAAPVVFVKALGLGMALAIALDATLVRMLLVPSTMGLLGRLNWWRPRWRGRR